MSVHEKNTIDRCGLTNDGKAMLIMYCSGELGADYTIEDIADKAETYLEFVLSGQLSEQVPECKGKAVIFRVSCEFWPKNEYKPRFAKMAKQLSEYEVELSVEVSSLRISGGTYDFTNIS
ncbi:hypothetical protein Meth11DRAFT_0271 [Methylophilaceae bacterium 11]|jgi:hypothetical protein|nr:hypothetical protein Meth11DRAFT_0271 [Methylophilaceae bacterium 11]